MNDRFFLNFCAGLAMVCGVSSTSALWAGDLGAAFGSLSEEARIAVQEELAAADLYLADADGDWNAATERALLRSVETIALNSGDRVHPKLSNGPTIIRYLEDLGEGTYSNWLERGAYSGGTAALRTVNLGL
jgi:hypothetical protein